MTSRAEQIVAAAVTKLTTPVMDSLPRARVHRDLVGALQSQLLPAIVIEAGAESAPAAGGVIGHKLRVIELRVSVFGTSFESADDPYVEAMSRLLSDPTLGGLAIDCNEGATTRERDDAERQRVAVTKTLAYQYRTTEESVE